MNELNTAKSEVARLLRENSALRERLEAHGEFPELPLDLGSTDNLMAFARQIVGLAARGDRWLRFYLRALKTVDTLRTERGVLLEENGRLRAAIRVMLNSNHVSNRASLQEMVNSMMTTGAPF